MTPTPSPSPSRAGRRRRPPSPTHRRRVLVVDDELVVTDTTVAILRRWGYAAEGAYDYRGAIERAHQWRPDIVLMDVLLPDGSGVAAAFELHAELPGVCVVLMSGQTVTSDLLAEARGRGLKVELLSKPITPPALLEKIETFCPS